MANGGQRIVSLDERRHLGPPNAADMDTATATSNLGGGNGGGGGSMTDVTRDQVREMINDKLAAAEGRLTSSISGLSADVRVLSSQVQHLPSTWQLICIVAGGFVATVALVIGVLTFGNEKFDTGANVSVGVAEMRSVTEENAKQIKELSRQSQRQQEILDLILRAQQPPTNGRH